MSPRTPQQFKEIREEKRALIMDVALLLFAREGFHGTSISNIARQAGISKGLLYNYFESKEDLLSSIIGKVVSEIGLYFDLDKDGYLTQEEFEFFVRRTAGVIKEKRTFFRLLFQVLMQTGVREHFINLFPGKESSLRQDRMPEGLVFITAISNMLTDYFIRKKETREPGYDPYLNMNMFIITLKGFIITYIYTDEGNDVFFEKTVEQIIAQYK